MMINRNRRTTLILALAVALCATGENTAMAVSFHTFDVWEVYSNADGTIQFIELREAIGANNQHLFMNKHFRSDANDYTYPNNLPDSFTANKSLLMATAGFASLPGAVTPDFVIPDNFFSISGDTLELAMTSTSLPVDSLTFTAGQLPTDGISSLNRNLTIGINSPTNYAGQTGSIDLTCAGDNDGDGYGTGAGCAGPDCDDNDADINPGAPEICDDLKDNDCDFLSDCDDPDCCVDADGDGYGTGLCCLGPDCDDSDVSVNPAAAEICDDVADNDCDTLADCDDPDCCTDNDGDGFGADPCCLGADCDDGDSSVNAGAAEICDDLKDNDCDTLTDCDDPDCCVDGDGDGYGEGLCCLGPDCDDSDISINPSVDGDGDGWHVCEDCDDANSAINPGVDADGDGWHLCEDCDDGDNAINPGVAEDCLDGVDNDCDQATDAADPDCFSIHPPLTAPFPHDRRKNRYFSFDPNKAENDGTSIAFKVELLSIYMGSCADATGGNVDFCRIDRGADDCNACTGSGDACINASIDCPPGESCVPTGAVCVNDLPNSGGSNVSLVWWVGPEKSTATDPSLNIHLLVTQPFRKVSTDWPNPVHAGDCEVVPQASYGVRAVETAGGTESDELVVETTQFPPLSPPAPFWWGDVVGVLAFHCNADIREQTCDAGTSNGECTGSGTPASCCTGVGTGLCDCPGGDPCTRAWELPNGVTNVDDVTAALWTSAPAPPTTVSAEFTWVDVHGNDSFTPGSQNFDPPNNKINASDLQQIISAFGGFPYKFYDPADCPDESDWP